MTPTWGEFMTKLRALYKEYPTASKQYESDYDALAARLAEALRVLDTIDEVGEDHYYSTADEARMILRGVIRTADSASVALCAKCGNNGDYGECSRCGRRLVGAGG